MEEGREKWVMMSFIAGGLLVAYILSSSIYLASGYFDLEARFRHFDWMVRGLSFGAGLITFIALGKMEVTNQYMHEVVAELSRVTWPTMLETRAATVMVVIMVLIAGFLLGVLDSVWTNVLDGLLKGLIKIF